MNIVLIVPYNPLIEVSGLELITVRLAGSLISKDNNVSILTKGISGFWYENNVRIIGFKDINSICHWILNFISGIDVILWMEIFPGNNEFELQYFWSNFFKNFYSKKVFLMVATSENMRSRGGGHLWGNYVKNSMNGFFVYNMEQIKEFTELGIPEDIIYNFGEGVDIDNIFFPISDQLKTIKRNAFKIENDKIIILFVGRFVDRKRPDFLLDIWSEMEELHASCELMFVGSGLGHMESIEELLIEKCKDKQHVKIFTHCLDIWNYYQIADIVIIPSVREGLPLVLLESMASGLPVIASAIPGIKDIIKNQETGLLCSPSSMEEFKLAIKLLVERKDLRKRIGKKAYEYIKKERELGYITDKYLKIFNT